MFLPAATIIVKKSNQVINTKPPFAAAVKKSLGSKLLVGSVGGLHGGISAQDVLEMDRADVVSVGRQFQKNPGQVRARAEELGVEIHVAHQMEWSFKGRGRKALGVTSTLNFRSKSHGLCINTKNRNSHVLILGRV